MIGPFHMDHDHTAGPDGIGAFRGWACISCNTGHGIIDDPDRLQTRVEFSVSLTGIFRVIRNPTLGSYNLRL